MLYLPPKVQFTYVNGCFGGKRNSLPRSFGDANGTLWTDTNLKEIVILWMRLH
jgi:hypothetical protein